MNRISFWKTFQVFLKIISLYINDIKNKMENRIKIMIKIFFFSKNLSYHCIRKNKQPDTIIIP